MEEWGPDPREPQVFSAERVLGCDVCILLVAMRRGYVPQEGGKSITELEYECALKNNIDVLVFMLSEASVWHRRFDELESDEKLRTWRTQLLASHGVGVFDHTPDSIGIAPALVRWMQRRHGQSDASPDP